MRNGRNRWRIGLQGGRFPLQLLTVGTLAGAVLAVDGGDAEGGQPFQLVVERIGADREGDEALLAAHALEPGMIFGELGLFDGDQLEIAAIGKANQRVVGAGGMRAAGGDGEAGGIECGACLVEMVDGDDDMVDSREHLCTSTAGHGGPALRHDADAGRPRLRSSGLRATSGPLRLRSGRRCVTRRRAPPCQ